MSSDDFDLSAAIKESSDDREWADSQFNSINAEDPASVVAFDLSSDGQRYLEITGVTMTVNLGLWAGPFSRSSEIYEMASERLSKVDREHFEDEGLLK
jgi:hypothetical protein|tara:strand:- start:2194 stop:2487 length:294 start_codon:yes stop_codon:yes gene_type:complete